MRANPKTMTEAALTEAAEIIRWAGKSDLNFEALSILYNGFLADILDEQDNREHARWQK